MSLSLKQVVVEDRLVVRTFRPDLKQSRCLLWEGPSPVSLLPSKGEYLALCWGYLQVRCRSVSALIATAEVSLS